MTTATGMKSCVNCHKDVTHGRRMRDSTGNYWCVECGRADTKRKKLSTKHCVDCRGKYPVDQMTLVDGFFVCNGCTAARDKERGHLMAAPVDEALEGVERARSGKIKLAVAVVALAIGITMISLNILGIWDP